MFSTSFETIQSRLQQIDPARYARTRNYSDGAVTKLSPYISRGVLSTKQVFTHVRSLGLPFNTIEKLVQELAWRDYWQHVWIAKGEAIDRDLRYTQHPVISPQLSAAIINHKTGIEAVDKAIKELYETGYMHNHMRMYVASLACNISQTHWRQPARWMYSHLLDGDWASNALSWQWVAGANANKKYYANQENINRFFNSDQQNTYLDVAYSEFDQLAIPSVLENRLDLNLETSLPTDDGPTFDRFKKTLLYNYYNLDPIWYKDEDVQRVLLVEPSFFEKYPVNQNCIDFVMELAGNIPNIKLFVGEFGQLAEKINSEFIVFKEHPTNRHYVGKEEPRDWMFTVSGYYTSFFKFWKQCKKEIGE